MTAEDIWTIPERREEKTNESMRKRVNRELRRQWDRSLWRILPLPILSYLIVGTYLWHVETPDAWQRAAAPVIAIVIFKYSEPIVRRTWFTFKRKNFVAARVVNDVVGTTSVTEKRPIEDILT